MSKIIHFHRFVISVSIVTVIINIFHCISVYDSDSDSESFI